MMETKFHVFTDPAKAVAYYRDATKEIKEWDICRDVVKSKMIPLHKAIVLVNGAHQKRISYVIKDKLVDKLQEKLPWKKPTKDFEVLYGDIKELLYPFQGRVTLYDIPFHLGLGINILPKEYVYITSGHVAENASLLLDIPNSKLGIKRAVKEFPSWLQNLSAERIEDFLCHVKIEKTETGLVFSFKKGAFPYKNYYPQEVRDEIAKICDGKYKDLMKPNTKKNK